MSPLFHVGTRKAKATAMTQRHTAQPILCLPSNAPENVQLQGPIKAMKLCARRAFGLSVDGSEARFTGQRTGCLHLATVNTPFRFSGGLE